MPEEDLWRSLMQMALGLKHIHDHHLLHLDLKPSNVFIADQALKLGDYGRMIRVGAEFEPGMEGDCKYIPLEVLQNAAELAPVGPPADVFALGMTMFELTTNIEPPSVGENWLRMRSGQLHTYVPEAHQRSAELVEMLAAMCAQDPRKRPSCDQILSHKRIWPLLQQTPAAAAAAAAAAVPPSSPRTSIMQDSANGLSGISISIRTSGSGSSIASGPAPAPAVSETPPRDMLLADTVDGEFFDRTLLVCDDDAPTPHTPAPAHARGPTHAGPAGHVRPKNLLFEFDRLG